MRLGDAHAVGFGRHFSPQARARLPTLRDLAGALQLNYTTVARGYSEARKRGLIDASGMDEINMSLKRMERFWTEQIRYIY